LTVKQTSLILCLFLMILPSPCNYSETPEKAEEFLKQTLPKDLDTASYYELVAWCKNLGLSTRGNKQELQSRLLQHYGLPKPETKTDIPQNNITIKSARELNYYTLEIIDENYVLFNGKVVIEIKDNNNDSLHSITADKILFNQTQEFLFAEGNVEYLLIKKESTDRFVGESLFFNIKTYEGNFQSGVSQRETKVGERDLVFYFQGNKIERSAGNIITLKDGTITSCDLEDPHYHIKAKKIWILSPDEWAIQNAILNVGRLPVLYIPFFFHPGDEFFFHPSLGFKSREGYFFQTSTYLLGRKKKEASSLSILQIAESGTGDYELKREGLFLRKIQSDAKTTKDENHIKILFDTYLKLGGFLGADINLQNLGVLNKLTFWGGFGRTRTLFYEQGVYSPYVESEEGLTSYWNNSSIYGVSFPFRYGGLLEVALKHKYFTLTGTFPLYSDIYFKSDFADRSEQVDWAKLMNLESASSTTTGTTPDNTIAESYKWRLQSTLTPPIEKLKPYVSTLRISNLDLEIDWKSKELPKEKYGDIFPGIPTTKIPAEFPEKRFYFPETAVLPLFSASVSGVLFSSRREVEAEIKKMSEEDFQGTILSPWEEERVQEEEQKGQAGNETLQDSLLVPEVQKPIPLTAEKDYVPFSHELSYTFTPYSTITNRFNSSSWNLPEDIDFTVLYSFLNLRGTSNFNYQLLLYEKAVILKNTLTVSGNLDRYYSQREEDVQDWEKLREKDRLASFFRLANSINVTVSPFFQSSVLYPSQIKYTLSSSLYELVYNEELQEHKSIFAQWNKETVTIHKVEFTFGVRFLGADQKVSLAVNLPPLNSEIVPEINLVTGPLTTVISTKILKKEEEQTWSFEPLLLKETLKIGTLFTLQQQINYDYRDQIFTTGGTILNISLMENKVIFTEDFTYNLAERKPLISKTSINLWYFKGSFEARETNPYTFSLPEGWKREEETLFLPYNLSAGFSREWKPEPYWKNRIKITSSVTSLWNMNLIRFTENSLTFNINFSLVIKDILNISFSSRSENRATFLYFPGLIENIEEIRLINPIIDLLKSFNFFNLQDRYESNFKLKNIALKATHHLHDWDVILEYAGKPELITNQDGSKEYKWIPNLTINFQWNPIPEIKRAIILENEELRF